jgi:hypothetical protein
MKIQCFTGDTPTQGTLVKKPDLDRQCRPIDYEANDSEQIMRGETSLPFICNLGAMIGSLRRRTRLSPQLSLHSGHGPMTTLGNKLAANPFLDYIRQERGLSDSPDFSWTLGT